MKKGRLLLFSYAFPPMQTQMTPVVTKAMAQLCRNGYEVDVLTSLPFSPYLGIDDSLLPYVEKHFGKIERITYPNTLLRKIRIRLNIFSTIPDLMFVLHKDMFNKLMNMELEQYDAIVTWSPFHSINPVMVKLKKHRPAICWLAQFSDPWAGNTLEQRKLIKLWSQREEPAAVAAADFIVHSSEFSRDLMMQDQSQEKRDRSAVCHHPFDETLFPQRARAINERITLRFIGMLFGRRSPEPLFQTLNLLLEQRPELRDKLNVELVGAMESSMLTSSAALALPQGLISHIKTVSYVESLEKMYDADILLLIEADVKNNLFVPSKLSDYMGACRPIVGLVSPGGSENILKKLGGWYAKPSDIDGICMALQNAIDYVIKESAEKESNEADLLWYDEKYRNQFSGQSVADKFIKILKEIKPS